MLGGRSMMYWVRNSGIERFKYGHCRINLTERMPLIISGPKPFLHWKATSMGFRPDYSNILVWELMSAHPVSQIQNPLKSQPLSLTLQTHSY